MPDFRGYRDPRTLIKLRRDVQKIIIALDRPSQRATWTSRLPSDALNELIKRVASAFDRHRFGAWPEIPLSANDGHIVALKDNIITTALPSSAGSNILKGYVAPRAATVVRLLEEAGMLVLEKTNMDEFGMGSHSLNSAFGPVTNGKNARAISVGGSSGGSALAVAGEICHFALGTDTGGSVRLPAAYLNLVGFKPSYGLISRHGVVPYANSLDTVGILAKSCLDVFLLFKILNQPDTQDPTCLDRPTRERISLLKTRRVSALQGKHFHLVPAVSDIKWNSWAFFNGSSGSRGKDMMKFHNPKLKGAADYTRRIGVPKEYNIEELQPEIRVAWTRTLSFLASFGHTIVPISLPSTKQALSAYYVLAPAEASSNLAKYDGVRFGSARTSGAGDGDDVLYSAHRGDHFGEEVRRRVLLGSFSLSAGARDNYFLQAQKIRRLVQDDFNMVFKHPHPLLDRGEPEKDGVDFIICPTAPTYPPRISSLQRVGPLETYMNDIFTVPASLAGLPAISIPAIAHHSSLGNLPEAAIGMQIIGQFGDDIAVIQFAKRFFENRQPWHKLCRLVQPARVR